MSDCFLFKSGTSDLRQIPLTKERTEMKQIHFSSKDSFVRNSETALMKTSLDFITEILKCC